ncbi:hypothetical protein [Limnobacter sp.]|uniref:hypothetical protein n=1 Tax=Limnobacter sp. TaxID=2003368 RepID=UPI00391DF980
MTGNTQPVPKRLNSDFELYRSAISGDPVATVLRFHLLTEYYLEQLIRSLMPRGDRIIESANFSYAQKLCVVAATNEVEDDLVSALRNLNKLRNKCSHELHHKITASDLESIGSPLGKDWTEIKKEHAEVETRMNYLFGLISAFLTVELDAADAKLIKPGGNAT